MENSGLSDWKLVQIERNFTDIRIPLIRNSTWIKKVLAISDPHIDSIRSDRKWLKNVFDQCVEHDAPILFFGDLLDVMQAKADPRHTKAEINPSYIVPGKQYFDLLIEDVTEFLLPYRKQIALLCPGNHESNIAKRGEWDPITMIASNLKYKGGCPVQQGGYSGNVRLSYERRERKRNTRESYIDIAYHHGSGIKSRASKIRFANENADCKVLVTGHYHEEDAFPLARMRISPNGKRYKEKVEFIALGTAKDDRGDSHEGYATEKFHGLTIPSAHWLDSYYDRLLEIVDIEPRRARAI